METPPIQKEQSKPQKTQEQLREALESRLSSLKQPLDEEIEKYEEDLNNDEFEDKEGEEKGSGEKRKEEAQNKISSIIARAEKMKTTLDSGKELPQFESSLTTTYTYTNPETNKVEINEQITLDIEQRLSKSEQFYKNIKINLPPDFNETIGDIWERNYDEIQKAVEEQGFNRILVIPGNLPPLPNLKDKTAMENGYYEYSNFTDGGSFAKAKSPNTDPSNPQAGKPRIILIHDTQNLKDRPDLAKTLNIKGEDLNLNNILSLEEYLILQKEYNEETKTTQLPKGKHLDEIGWTWLGTKSGARLVGAGWDSGNGRLFVDAHAPDDQSGPLGARPSRSFF